MAFGSRRRRRRVIQPLVSSTPATFEPNHFMKIILPAAIHDHEMRIPTEFVRRFENELSREATITVPDGLVWKMELRKSENEVWFCNNWQQFVKYYSISFGYFLMFKYEGNSHFSVVIFDMSATEIYYPCKGNSEKENWESKCSSKRSTLDHCDYIIRSKRYKLEEKEEIIDVDDVNAVSLPKLRNNRSCISIENSRKYEKDKSGQTYSSETKSTLKTKLKAIKAAQNFKPVNPSFTAIVKPANMIRYYMDVPASFSRAYLGKLVSVKLQDYNGQQWKINVGHGHKSTKRMGKGWIDFARANNLKEGDVCVFELIKRKNIVLKVNIFAC